MRKIIYNRDLLSYSKLLEYICTYFNTKFIKLSLNKFIRTKIKNSPSPKMKIFIHNPTNAKNFIKHNRSWIWEKDKKSQRWKSKW